MGHRSRCAQPARARGGGFPNCLFRARELAPEVWTSDKWSFCLTVGKTVPRIRRDDENAIRAVHALFASDCTTLKRVEVRHSFLSDWFPSSPRRPVANRHIRSSSDMSPESAVRQAALEFLDLFRRPRLDLKSSPQGMPSRKKSAPVPAPFGQHLPGHISTQHAGELLNSLLSWG